MIYNEKLCKLVINNMSIVEAAPKIAEEIEIGVFNSINKRCKEFSKEQGWEGVFDIFTGDENKTRFSPEKWKANDGEITDGYYIALDEECDERWLTVFLNQRPGSLLGFQFYIHHYSLQGRKNDFIKLLDECFYGENYTAVKDSGFRRVDDYLFFPVLLNKDDLIRGLSEDSFDSVLGPINAGLKVIRDTHKHLHAIREEIIGRLGEKDK